MDATTLARVRASLRKDPSPATEDDALLGDLITEASAAVEKYLNISFLQQSYTEVHTVHDPRQLSLFLRATPVASMTSLKFDSTGQFDGDETTYTADDYILHLATGELRFRFQPTAGFKVYQVVYTGGLATTAANLVTAYPLIARAVDHQVVAMFHRTDDPQAMERSLGGATVKLNEPMGLCAAARQTAAPHRRIRFAG